VVCLCGNKVLDILQPLQVLLLLLVFNIVRQEVGKSGIYATFFKITFEQCLYTFIQFGELRSNVQSASLPISFSRLLGGQISIFVVKNGLNYNCAILCNCINGDSTLAILKKRKFRLVPNANCLLPLLEVGRRRLQVYLFNGDRCTNREGNWGNIVLIPFSVVSWYISKVILSSIVNVRNSKQYSDPKNPCKRISQCSVEGSNLVEFFLKQSR
jgi:hypothetical protein